MSSYCLICLDVVVDVLHRDVKPKETVTVTVRLVGNIEPDEDGRILTMDMSFNCSEIQSSFTGGYSLELHVPK